MPFLGILQDSHLQHIPGTVILDEKAAHAEATVGALKHGHGRNKNVILVPQPSSDPNDPLNWPLSKRLVVFGITCWGTILYAAVVSAMLNPAFYVMELELGVPLSALIQTTGYQTLVVGVTGPLFAAVARKYGKRPIFIMASTICLIANIVGACMPTYHGVLASRILQGFAIAPYESLVYAMLSDLFFLHERGMYTSLVNFCLAGVSNITAVVSGPIASSLSWRWLYYLLILFGGIQLILQYLFVPETSFVRSPLFDLDENVEVDIDALAALEQEDAADVEKHTASSVQVERTSGAQMNATQSAVPTKKNFVEELTIFNGKFSSDNLLQSFIAPFAVLTNVAVAWVVLINSMFVLLYVIIVFVIPQEFGPPPYLLGATDIGFLSFGPFVGGILGALMLGILSDPMIKWCARRNNGVFEPEYRLLPTVFGLVSGACLMGWGTMVSEGVSPVDTAVVHGVFLFGTMCVCISTSTYAIDAFRGMTAEIFIASMATKNLLIYGFSYFVNDWTLVEGIKNTFFVWGGIAMALTASTLVVYVVGKKYRSYWARHDLMKKWHVRTHEE